MSSIAGIGIRETHIPHVEEYQRRVHRLALIYCALFVISLIGIAVLIWQGKLFITIAQRSNVETLTFAFFFVFFFYVACLSVRGVRGSFQILHAWISRDTEQTKLSYLSRRTSKSSVGLNVAVEAEDKAAMPLQLTIRDDHGLFGSVVFDGARITHIDNFGDGSNSLFAFLVQQIRQMLGVRGDDTPIEIVEWSKIDDEENEKYLAQVQFARNLERHLNTSGLWPRVRLTHREIATLENHLTRLCPTLRSEALLPDWEYSGEHKIPIIPEPLGIISLSRNEKRVDPIAAMGASLVMLILMLGILLALIFFPPWVPGV